MERLNIKSVSVFIVLNILLVCLVSTQVIADPVQEQIECDFDLPAGPFLRLEGTGVELDILGQALSGDFVFEQATPPPPISIIKLNVSLCSGLVVPIRGDDTSAGMRFAEGARVFFGSREACAGIITGSHDLEDGTTDLAAPFLHGGAGNDRFLLNTLPAGPFLRVEGTGLELDILGQTLSGNFAFKKATSPAATGNIYINVAYGTTRVDVPICGFQWWPIPVAPGGGLDCYSTQKGLRTLKPEIQLHYDSGKADGTVNECQTTLGYGWTHNYNLYLVKESSDIFMADSKGRMTRFKEDGMGGYTVSDGQTHTLTQMGPTFLLEEVDGSSMVFQQATPAPVWAYGKDVYLLKEIEDTRGRTIDFSYNGESLLQTITDPYGRQVQFSYVDYSGKMLLNTITDPDMQTTVIVHDPTGEQLQVITDPEGNALTYNYDGSGRMTTATLKDGQIWTCQYDAGAPWNRYIKDPNNDVYATVTNSTNWARDLAHPDSNEYRYSSSQTTVTDGEGNITTLDLDENGYVMAVGHPGQPDKTFVFDGDLRLTTLTDQAGSSWLYDYDANGNLTDVNDPLNNHMEMFYEHPTIPLLCTKIIEPDSNMWQFEWDPNGNLTSIIDPIVELPTDKVTTYSYTYYPGPPYGRFQTVTRTNRNGYTSQLEFDPNGNIARMIADPCGLDLTTDYEYDPVGRMTRKTRFREAVGPNTVVTTYTYDSIGRLTDRSIDPDLLNLNTQYEYDGCGRITKMTNPRGIITDYDYDYRGRLVGSTFDPCDLAFSTGYSYDGCDRRIGKTDAKGYKNNYEYDSLNRLIKIVDANEYWTEYEYDDRSNLTYLKRSIDPGAAPYRITKYEYDSLNRLIQMRMDPCDLNLSTAFEYAPTGGGGGRGTPGTALVHKITDAEGKVTYNYYDNLDRLTSVVNKVGDTNDNGGDPNDATIDYEYDSVGNIIRTIVENAPEPNLVTAYSYDAADRLIKQVADPCDANLVTSYTYDGTGSIISQTTPTGNVFTYSYDSANRLTNISDSIGQVVSYSYDDNSNLISRCDGLGNTWTYTYDNADRVTDACDPLIETPTDKYTTYEYDKNSNLVRNTDNEGLVTDYEYDSLNRLISTTKAPGGFDVTNTIEYDGLGNKISATDDNGNVTDYEYDGLNRLIREEFADGTEMLFSYDGTGNLISETDQMANTTGYSYDDLNRLITRSYADGKADTFDYDRAGQILSADNNDSHIGYTYDGAGRVISNTQTDVPQTYSYVVSYAYATEPNVTRTITSPDGNEVTETYDVRDRLIEVERDGNTIALYTYDDPGDRLLTKNFDNGTQSLYSYNDNDWVTKLVHKAPDDSNFAGFAYDYDAVGNRLNAVNLQTVLPYDDTKPVTQSRIFTYDSICRLTDSKRGQWTGGDVPLPTRERSWTFDGVSNWQQFSIQDTIDTSENGSYVNSINQMNEYDDTSTNGPAPVPDDDGQPDDFMVNANPLAGDFGPDGDVDFNDLVVTALHWLDECSGPGWCDGADIDQSTDVNFVDYGYLALNWLDSAPGFYNSAHDKNGNLVDDDVAEYYWDYDHRPISTASLRARNLLTQVRRKSDSQILGQYWYDALGRRISKTVDGISTVFVYDGWQVIEEYDNSIPTGSFIYGDELDEVLVMLDASAIPSYYHADIKGSTIAVTDAAAAVSERYTYDAYGRPYFADADGNEISESAIENPYLFTGRRYDGETDLYYYRTRYLHPQRGRFISGDVIGNWGDLANLGNGYTYVANNPINYTDPFGLQPPVDWTPPKIKPKPRPRYRYTTDNVKFSLDGVAPNIMISQQDALELKPDDPATKILKKCRVVIISGGWVIGKEG